MGPLESVSQANRLMMRRPIRANGSMIQTTEARNTSPQFSGNSLTKSARTAGWAFIATTLLGFTLGGPPSGHAQQKDGMQRIPLAENTRVTPKNELLTPDTRFDTWPVEKLQRLATSQNPKAVQMLAEKLETIPDLKQRRALTESILSYRKAEALQLRQEVAKLHVQEEPLQEQWDQVEEKWRPLSETLNALLQQEKQDADAIQKARAALAPIQKERDDLEAKINQITEQSMPKTLLMDDITQASALAIKHGLTTFAQSEPQFVLDQLSALTADPRGKIRNVATVNLKAIQRDADKLALIEKTIRPDFQAPFYGPGTDNDTPVEMVASSSAQAAASIKDETLRIKAFTHISQQPWSPGKNAVTGAIASVKSGHERYRPIIVNVSNCKIPGHFVFLQDVLKSYPKPEIKRIIEAVAERGLKQADDTDGSNYSRSLAVVLLPHLGPKEDAFKMERLKAATTDRHADVRYSAMMAGLPLDQAENRQAMLDFYAARNEKNSKDPVFFQGLAIALIGQGTGSQATIHQTLSQAVKHPQPWVRLSVIRGSEALSKSEQRLDLLKTLSEDMHPAVKQAALKILHPEKIEGPAKPPMLNRPKLGNLG